MEHGERECAKRYELIRSFCAEYRRPFTVLDIGAASAYFCRRLTESFPDCTAVGIESDMPTEDIPAFFRGTTRIVWLRHHFTLHELRAVAECEHFDVVLGLSVIHHFGGSFEDRLQVFRSLGDNLILELAVEDEACGGDQKDYELPADHCLLGYGDSHLVEGTKRPIVLMSQMKTSISKAYIGSPRTDLSLSIYSDFLLKQVTFFNKKEERAWLRGLNLWTYQSFGGVWPTRAMIADQLEAQREGILAGGHGDINAWNIILQGDNVVFVDVHGPMDVKFDDVQYFDRLVGELQS